MSHAYINAECTPSNEHSPGPWVALPHKGNEKRFQVRGPEDGMPIARFVCENAMMANARLIAAAPELLKALKEAEMTIRWAAQEAAGRVKAEIVGGWLYHADEARQAIAKAEGRE